MLREYDIYGFVNMRRQPLSRASKSIAAKIGQAKIMAVLMRSYYASSHAAGFAMLARAQ